MRWLLVSLLAMAVCAGCRWVPAEERDQPLDTLTMDGASETPAAGCVDDRGCTGYLRCMEAICQIPPAITGDHDEYTPRVTIYSPERQDVTSFYLELAVTSWEMTRGLMFRTAMQDDWGMLFIYPDEGHRSFWMENTLLSLDMLFIDDAGEIIGIVHEAEPRTRTPRQVEGESRYVLEIKGGLARSLGLEAGGAVTFENLPDDDDWPRRQAQ